VIGAGGPVSFSICSGDFVRTFGSTFSGCVMVIQEVPSRRSYFAHRGPTPKDDMHMADPGVLGGTAATNHACAATVPPLRAELDSGVSEMDKLIVSVAEAAEMLGVSDDLVYELTARGDLPCLRLGRRKVIPRQAIESLVAQAVTRSAPSIRNRESPSAM
jgi:excisionase family DNA binding protein